MLVFKPLTEQHNIRFIQHVRRAAISQYYKGWFLSEDGHTWIIVNEHPSMGTDEFNESCEITVRSICLMEGIAGTFEVI